MNKQEFINFVETKSVHDLKKDTYGNYKGISKKGSAIRYKIQKSSVRFERQYSFEWEGKVQNSWKKVWSEYYTNLEINPETGGLRKIKR